MTTGSLRAFAAYAKEHGMASDAVSYYHRQKMAGRMVMVMQAGRELVDFEASLAALQATSDPGKAYMAEVNDRQRMAHRGGHVAPTFDRGDDSAGSVSMAVSGASKNATYMQAKTAREVYDAKMSQLDYERETGKLIKKQEVEAALFEIARAVRDGLTNSARRIAAEVSSLTTADECEAVIDRENRAILENMTKAFKDRLQSEAAA